jgi:hypothetical protein
MKLASPRRDRRIVAAAVVGMFAVIVALWWLSEQANDRAVSAERAARVDAEEKVQALEGLTAATAALQDQCRKGIESACHQLVGLNALPDPSGEGERQDAEVQEAEIQEPEVQEAERDDIERNDPDPDDPEIDQPERQDPEANDPEQQDSETDDPDSNDPETDDPDSDDPEKQDEEVQNDEQQDPEIDDPEIQDEETQDPEHDDPDPNSLLGFLATDSCSPSAGEVVVDVDLTVLRDPDASTVTYVLTCKSVPIAALINPPGPSR